MEADNVEVFVKISSGAIFSFSLAPWATIQTVCRELSRKLDIPDDLLCISFIGKVLDKTNSLGFLGVRSETVLKAEILECKLLTLTIRSDADDFNVEIENISPVSCIRYEIKLQTGIEQSTQILKLSRGQELKNDDWSLVEYGIKDGETISLSVKPAKAAAVESSDSCEFALEKDEVVDLEVEEKEELMKSFGTDGRPVEVVFCFDTTGSMFSCLKKVRENIRSTVTQLIENIPGIRIGIMAHGDYCDYRKYVTKHIDLTADVNALVKFVKDVDSTGGGDAPECYELALKKAQLLSWADNSAKAFVMIGDELPHPPSYTDQNLDWRSEVDVLAGMGVKVYGIQALNKLRSKNFYQEIAQRTEGAYVSFQNFSVITEMFLAVCYREVSDEQYDQFCKDLMETKDDGGPKEDIKDVLQQLKTPAPQVPAQNDGELDWWCPVSYSRPQYAYNQETDSWTPQTTGSYVAAVPASRDPISCACDHFAKDVKKRKLIPRGKCVVM